jgi:hypothetical protein
MSVCNNLRSKPGLLCGSAKSCDLTDAFMGSPVHLVKGGGFPTGPIRNQ